MLKNFANYAAEGEGAGGSAVASVENVQTIETPVTTPVAPESDAPTSGEGTESADDSSFAIELFDALEGGEEAVEAGDGESASPVSAPVTTPNSQVATPAPVPGSTEAPVQAQAAQPAQQPVAQQTPAVVQPQAAAPNAPAANAQAQQPEQSSSPLDVMRAEIDKNVETFSKVLAENVYKLDDEAKDEILTSPETAVPKLLAKAHIQIVQNVLGTLAQQMPATIAGYLQAREQNTNLENKFYEAWPQLDRAKDGQTVLQLARSYRAQNPQASFEDTVKFVGSQAVVMLGRVAPAAPAQAPAAPLPKGFKPAANGTRQPKVVSAEQSPWDGIAQMMATDDDQLG